MIYIFDNGLDYDDHDIIFVDGQEFDEPTVASFITFRYPSAFLIGKTALIEWLGDSFLESTLSFLHPAWLLEVSETNGGTYFSERAIAVVGAPLIKRLAAAAWPEDHYWPIWKDKVAEALTRLEGE